MYFMYCPKFSFIFVSQVQGKDPSVDFTQDIVEESEDERCFDEISDSVPAIDLPQCDIGKLEEISELVSSCLPSPIRREKLAVAIENEGYIKKLLNLFHICEDLENTEGLHHLYEIFKNIFLLNKNALFELMFAEDTIFDVVGCLEFDPNLSSPKRHRQYLKSIASFHEVIKINNPELLSKIHQTYRYANHFYLLKNITGKFANFEVVKLPPFFDIFQFEVGNFQKSFVSKRRPNSDLGFFGTCRIFQSVVCEGFLEVCLEMVHSMDS